MLPQLEHPEYTVVLDSNGKTVKIRPFLVKEEKILLIAAKGDQADIIDAMKRILESCILTPGIVVDELPFFDIIKLFIKLRSISVGEVVEMKYSCLQDDPENKITGKCAGIIDVSINLDDLIVKNGFDPKKSNIMITDKLGIKMRYPGIKEAVKFSNVVHNPVMLDELLVDCIEFVFDDAQIYDSFTRDEITIFFNNLNGTQKKKMIQFFEGAPRFHHVIDTECPKCHNPVHLEFTELTDLFS